MVFNTVTVGCAITPAVVSTFISHYIFREQRAKKPTAHISYDEGLTLVRKFLLYASQHTVEDLQYFTSQRVPHPRWVKVDKVAIPPEHIVAAAEAIQTQLGYHGIQRVGGTTWWQWRQPGSKLEAEWVEMRVDYEERKKGKLDGKRVMLYVHGGAYYFGSVDGHRYQLQRHARKLRARVFTPKYRLAPQFPFPCGLHDCLAGYMYLLAAHDPTTIILAGDSAGAGMVLSMMVILRDRGIPLPAGAILISPWVDLTHSFPSVAADNPLDYIPPDGFHHKPSLAWPPPSTDELHQDSKWYSEQENDGSTSHANTVPGPGRDLSITIDGKLVHIKDQIQMYASNQLISHPLVSPILQPSLGGLPPLLILTGGGEMLRDEQIYLAHKAANPLKYPPNDAIFDENALKRDEVNCWRPTDVQLQVWDDLCHVAPTLSFTRPAKYMYRSIAQFGAWVLAYAQRTENEILDEEVSKISRSVCDEDAASAKAYQEKAGSKNEKPTAHIGKPGDALPQFEHHMIRQRVSCHGIIRPLEPESSFVACNLAPSEIGIIKEGSVRKWLAAKKKWDTKFAASKRSVQKQRARKLARGLHDFDNGDVPPLSALAGWLGSGSERGEVGEIETESGKKAKSWGMSLWALWGSKHEEKTLEREKNGEKRREGTLGTSVATIMEGKGGRILNDIITTQNDHTGTS